MHQILAIAIAVLLIIIAIPFFTFVFSMAPPVPSTRKSRRQVVKYIDTYIGESSSILEIGTGWGGMTRIVAKANPDKKIISYEISLIPYLFSRLIFLIFPFKNVELHYGDAFKAMDKDEINPDCMIFYLCSGLEQRMSDYNGFIITVNFPIKNRTPLDSVVTNDFAHGSVYVYDCKK